MEEQSVIESREEMEKILLEEAYGSLGLCLDGKPYVVPLNYAYQEGKILFHCRFEGKKLDYIRANPQVCFTVARQPGSVRAHPGGSPCHVDSDSVICYGKARVIEDVKEREAALNAFNHHFRPQAPDIALDGAINCNAVEIRISEMTGRQERERERTYWRYAFPEQPDRKLLKGPTL
jgi:nitroimidazol reductase NimA-like FMN-containing flavoprotein (pyridoxamine 5'-phosphate oxidase superfamily)